MPFFDSFRSLRVNVESYCLAVLQNKHLFILILIRLTWKDLKFIENLTGYVKISIYKIDTICLLQIATS